MRNCCVAGWKTNKHTNPDPGKEKGPKRRVVRINEPENGNSLFWQ